MKSIENIQGGIENFDDKAEWFDQECKEAMLSLAKTLTEYAEKGDSRWFLAHIQSSAVEQIRTFANEADTAREKAKLLRFVLGE